MIQPFTPDHLLEMLDVCDVRKTSGFRDYLIIVFLADTGIRLDELCRLQLEDVVTRDATGHGYIQVLGKGRRQREVGVSPDVMALLWKYIKQYREPQDERGDCLFLSYCGKPLNPTGVSQLLRRVKQRAEIGDRRVSPHTFRHTLSTAYLEQGGKFTICRCCLGIARRARQNSMPRR
jgi:integrase/recombinase XerD